MEVMVRISGNTLYYLNNNVWQTKLKEDSKKFKVNIYDYEASETTNLSNVNMKIPTQSALYKLLFLESNETIYSKYWFASTVLKRSSVSVNEIYYGLLQVSLDGVGY